MVDRTTKTVSLQNVFSLLHRFPLGELFGTAQTNPFTVYSGRRDSVVIT